MAALPLALALLWPAPACASASTLRAQADAAHGRMDYAEAYRLYRRAAAQGDAEAMVRVGQCYDHGAGVAEDALAAQGWYQKAADRGDYRGQFERGESLSCGCGGEVDLEMSRQFLKQCLPACQAAAAKDQPDAEHALGTLYLKGWAGLEPDRGLAIEWFTKAAAHDWAGSCDHLAQLYADTDKALSERWRAKAYKLDLARAEHGSGEAQATVAYDLTEGLGVAKDIEAGQRWRLRAAAAGNRWAMRALGMGLLEKDPAQAKVWLGRAAERGEYNAAAWMAEDQFSGKGRDADQGKGRQWLMAAATEGGLIPQLTLAADLQKGKHFKKDAAQAEQWRHKALEQALYVAAPGHYDALQALKKLADDAALSDEDRSRVRDRLHGLAQWGDAAALDAMKGLGWFYRLGDAWAVALYYLLLLASVGGAWLAAGWASWKARLKLPLDPGATLFNVAAIQDLLSVIYIGLLLNGFKAFGIRIYRPLAGLFGYGHGSALLLIAGMFAVAVAGWLLLRSSRYGLDNQLRGIQWPWRERLSWSLRGSAPWTIPLLTLVLGVAVLKAMAQGAAGIGLVWLAVVPLLLAQPFILRRAYGMVALPEGALIRSARRLAEAAGVQHQGFYLWNTDRPRLANAMVVGGAQFNRHVVVTTVLMQELTLREQEAVMAHELGHVKLGHHALLGLAAACFTPLLFIPGCKWMFWAGLLLVLPIVRRHLELAADAFAAKLTGDPDALGSALLKLDRVNGVPYRFNLYHRLVGSHPSTAVRVERLGRLCKGCYAANSPRAKFCKDCGKALGRAPQPPAGRQPRQAAKRPRRTEARPVPVAKAASGPKRPRGARAVVQKAPAKRPARAKR